VNEALPKHTYELERVTIIFLVTFHVRRGGLLSRLLLMIRLAPLLQYLRYIARRCSVVKTQVWC